ncbi:MAG TPA: DUF3224 domain-containing protein [Microlunatus sp.]|nr:DUF3224 domain-containing protein [Microlunatus sp.]
MHTTVTHHRSRNLRRAALAGGGTALALVLATASPSAASSLCQQVRGSYTEHAVSGNCQSPVGLCIIGTYTGQIRGEFRGQATTISTTADTPTTGVATFTSDSTITATIGQQSGTLIIKNAGAFAASNGGPIVDLQTIVGGTGDLAGASGALRATGTFQASSGGHSDYEGTVCIP